MKYLALGALVAGSALATTRPNPNVDELCELYSQRSRDKKQSNDEFTSAIFSLCSTLPTSVLKNPARPAQNFRSVFIPISKIYRSGQVGPADSTGYNFPAAKACGVDIVVDLRFDPKAGDYTSLFGARVAKLPLSSGEVNFNYAQERDFLVRQGIRSVYLPTVPEMEHFIGNYVPRLDVGPGSKPYFCRLPQNFPDGEKLHWIDDSLRLMELESVYKRRGIRVPLVSHFKDCRDLDAVYGITKVRKWLGEVEETSAAANQRFIDIANELQKLADKKSGVLVHCSSGTDRVGRVSINLETAAYGVTLEELKHYRGPGSDARIDLIAVNYLLSQRAGSSPQYRYLFPDLDKPELSFIGMALTAPVRR